MNKLLKVGLALQIPNLTLLVTFFIFWVIPYLTISLILWVIGGTIYALLNIVSIILLITGILNNYEN